MTRNKTATKPARCPKSKSNKRSSKEIKTARRKPAGRQVATGGQRMAQLGYHGIQLWVTADERAKIKEAAQADRRPMTAWIMTKVIDALDAVLKRENISSIEPLDKGGSRP